MRTQPHYAFSGAIPGITGIGAAAIGALVLVGWYFNLEMLKRVFPDWTAMSPTTAVCFVIAGLSLAVLALVMREGAPVGRWALEAAGKLSVFGAGLVLVIAVVKLAQYAGFRIVDVDALLFAGANFSHEAVMAPATAVDVVLAGAALLLARYARSLALFQILVVLGASTAWLGLSQYIFGGEHLPAFSHMSVYSAVSFLLLNAGILCLRTESGLMSLLLSDGPAGLVARRLVPSALILPMIIGLLGVQGQRAGWFGPEAGVSLSTLSLILIFSGITWASATLLHRSDIERREAEKEKEWLASFPHENPNPVVEIDLDGRVYYQNPRTATLFPDLIHRGFDHPWVAGLQEAGRSLKAGAIEVLQREIEVDGRPYTQAVSFVPATERLRIYGSDVTQLKEFERHLARERDLLRLLISNLPACIYVKDPQGKYILFNRACAEHVGLASESLGIGRTVYDFFPKETAELYEEDDQRVLKSGEPILQREEPALGLNGNQRWFLTSKFPLMEKDRPLGVVGISEDITERKIADNRLRSHLARLDLLRRTTHAIAERQDLHSILRVVVQNMEDHLEAELSCVCLYKESDKSLESVSVGARSQAVAAGLRLSERTSVGIAESGLMKCLRGELLYEPDVGAVKLPFVQQLAKHGLGSLIASPLAVERRIFGVLLLARTKTNAFTSGECEFVRQLSEHVALAAHQAELHGELQKAYDELRQTQQTVMQQERLRALGQMASGVAHDINNAIVPITLYTDLLLQTEEHLSAAGRNHLQTVQRSVGDVAQTVTRLREFYRQRETKANLAPVQLNGLVEQIIDLTSARWKDMPQQRGVVVRMVPELDDELPLVQGIESEIREALTNLIFNAVDAMPGGGTLTLRTRWWEPGAATHATGAEKTVCLEVCDTGMGMDEETRRRCLEPFFTTKGDRGSGLGLAMVYGIAKRMDGTIEIDSAPGKGTTVRILMPAARTVAVARATPSQDSVQRTMRILVVDDDPLVATTLLHALKADRHDVEVASNGEAGIQLFQTSHASGKPFDIVITDLGMPHVDGRQVANAVKTTSPTTPVILLTGWGQRIEMERDAPAHVDLVLSKPSTLSQLREALARFCPKPENAQSLSER